jgi:predicted protein tyrosine phosphatase
MIVVCSLNDLLMVCDSIKPSHLISVIDPGFIPETPKGITSHLKLDFDDIVKISSNNKIFRKNNENLYQKLPTNFHTNSIAQFSESWDKKSPLVIHCWCGVSRSMATATYFLCKEALSDIDRNIKYIRYIAPHANPNKILINLFEKSLNLSGQISLAYDKYPYTRVYDCSVNFAPVTIFNINDMKGFR